LGTAEFPEFQERWDLFLRYRHLQGINLTKKLTQNRKGAKNAMPHLHYFPFFSCLSAISLRLCAFA
jgi:hypothetical protein